MHSFAIPFYENILMIRLLSIELFFLRSKSNQFFFNSSRLQINLNCHFTSYDCIVFNKLIVVNVKLPPIRIFFCNQLFHYSFTLKKLLIITNLRLHYLVLCCMKYKPAKLINVTLN